MKDEATLSVKVAETADISSDSGPLTAKFVLLFSQCAQNGSERQSISVRLVNDSSVSTLEQKRYSSGRKSDLNQFDFTIILDATKWVLEAVRLRLT